MNSPTFDLLQITRHQFLGRAATGIGAAALASLLNPNLLDASDPAKPLLPHFAPRRPARSAAALGIAAVVIGLLHAWLDARSAGRDRRSHTKGRVKE